MGSLPTERPEERAPEQEPLAEDLSLERFRSAVALVHPDRQQLPWVVPIIERGPGIQPLEALQPDQLAPGRGGEHLGNLGLPAARLALYEQGLAQAGAQEHRCREGRLRDVGLGGQQLSDVFRVPPGFAVGHRIGSRRLPDSRSGTGPKYFAPLEGGLRDPGRRSPSSRL